MIRLSPLAEAALGYPVLCLQQLTHSFENPLSYVRHQMRGDMAYNVFFARQLDQSDFSPPQA